MKINKYIFVLLLVLLSKQNIFSQNNKITVDKNTICIYKEFVIDDGDTILLSSIPIIEIIGV